MVETITPVVHGGARNRYRIAVLAHVIGATTSALLLGAVLGALGSLMNAPWDRWGWAAVGVLAVAYLLREAAGAPIPVPQLRRQVPEWWRTFFSPAVAAWLYGTGLGIAFATYLPSGAFVVAGAAALVSGDPLLGAAITAPFGAARALSVLKARRCTTPEQAAALSDHLGSPPSIRRLRTLQIAALGAALVTATALAW
jgi:hypothetical protein